MVAGILRVKDAARRHISEVPSRYFTVEGLFWATNPGAPNLNTGSRLSSNVGPGQRYAHHNPNAKARYKDEAQKGQCHFHDSS